MQRFRSISVRCSVFPFLHVASILSELVIFQFLQEAEKPPPALTVDAKTETETIVRRLEKCMIMSVKVGVMEIESKCGSGES
jgi:hypothetical protein